MSLVEKVEFFVKKNAANLALRVSGYGVVGGTGSLSVFEGSYEFCRLEKRKYVVVNDSPTKQDYGLIAYIFDRKERKDVQMVFYILRISVEHPSHFVNPDGDMTIVDK